MAYPSALLKPPTGEGNFMRKLGLFPNCNDIAAETDKKAKILSNIPWVISTRAG